MALPYALAKAISKSKGKSMKPMEGQKPKGNSSRKKGGKK
jgi:hypothetical protein